MKYQLREMIESGDCACAESVLLVKLRNSTVLAPVLVEHDAALAAAERAVVEAADRFVTTNMERYKDEGEAFALKEAVLALRSSRAAGKEAT